MDLNNKSYIELTDDQVRLLTEVVKSQTPIKKLKLNDMLLEELPEWFKNKLNYDTEAIRKE
jgi:hypothetical protein